ncbi:MAG: hypothetical protein EOO98_00395 [Pedobacter sp.]|nr:MAG: hypothetical protein EOO98_00395 [Pedobacter sp.]
MKYLLKLIAIILFNFVVNGNGQAQTKPQTIVYTDIDNFWIAFDSLQTTTDSLKQYNMLQKLYVDKGTPGLKAFMQAKGYTTEAWLDCIRSYPKYWASIRPKTLKIKAVNKELDPYIAKFKQLYPAFKPANIYFTIGAMRSGGTTQNDKVLIGAELATGDPEVDISELPANTQNWLKTYFGTYPFKDVVLLNMHEFVHTQQKGRGNTLLTQTILEGTADFVAELITGKVPAMAYMPYGKQHEAQLKQQFKEEMFLDNYGNWLYNGASNNFGVADLGYYMGYAICKHYYQQAKDKKAVVKELIELDYSNDETIEKFLAKTGYFKEGFNKVESLKTYESKKPVVSSLSGITNGDKNVDATLTEMTIHFSKPMIKNRMSINLGEGGEANFPIKKSLGFAEDGKSIKFQLELKPKHTYNFVITGRGFRSTDGYPLAELPVSFTTR